MKVVISVEQAFRKQLDEYLIKNPCVGTLARKAGVQQTQLAKYINRKVSPKGKGVGITLATADRLLKIMLHLPDGAK